MSYFFFPDQILLIQNIFMDMFPKCNLKLRMFNFRFKMKNRYMYVK